MKLLLGVVLITLLFVGVLFQSPPQFSGWTRVTVASGDTEWSIAEAHCPSADTRDVVSAIEARNHTDGDIQPGQVLWAPTRVSYPY